jgi:hypothetical protein
MRRFNYALSILTLAILAAVPAVGQSIFVSNDEWVFSNDDLNLSGTDDNQFAQNVALWLTSNTSGGRNILILSGNYSLDGTDLKTLLESPPVNATVTEMTSMPSPFPTPTQYQAIYLSGGCEFTPLTFANAVPCAGNYTALDAALVTYVNAGGNVFLEGGLTCHDDRGWNGFLNAFGLSMDDFCNDILNSIVNVSPFQTQSPYGPGLFTDVNNVYIDNGENVKSLGTNSGVQIFTDVSGNGLYGAWRPPGATCVSGGAYSNGPVNATINAYAINFGFVTSDNFTVSSQANISDFCFYAWVYPGDSLESVEASFTSDEGGGTTYFDNTVNLDCKIYCKAGQPVNGGTCGPGLVASFDVYACTGQLTLALPSGTSWLNLQNAVVDNGDPVYWDQCTGSGCQSLASQNDTGAIPSESFVIY